MPAADMITPNQFELRLPQRTAQQDAAQTRDAVVAVHDLGPRGFWSPPC